MSVPSVTDELIVKTSDAINWLLAKLNEGVISEAECATAIRALWIATSGLVGDHLVQLMTQVSEGCEDGAIQTSIWRNQKGQMLLVRVNLWQGRADLFSLENGSQLGSFDHVNEVLAKLSHNGYERFVI